MMIDRFHQFSHRCDG